MYETCSISSDGVTRKLVETIVRSINNGELKPGVMIGTEVDLASQYSISRNSVRRAVSKMADSGLVVRKPGKGVFVSRQISKTRTIQIVLPSLANEIWARFAKGVKESATQRGVEVQIYDAHSNMNADIEAVRNLPNSFASGAIIPPLDHPLFTEALFELKQVNYPFVLVEGVWYGLQVSSVTGDDYGGGFMVGQELTRLGHKRIAFIGTSNATSSHRRLEGLRDAVGEAGLPFSPSLAVEMSIAPFSDESEPIAEATRRVMGLSPKPTAIFYSCDGAAAHGYNALKAMGLQIPTDISVVGFDDEPLCRFLDPPLSTVRPSSEQLGAAALEILLEQIDGEKEDSQISHCELPGQLIMRKSVARLDG